MIKPKTPFNKDAKLENPKLVLLGLDKQLGQFKRVKHQNILVSVKTIPNNKLQMAKNTNIIKKMSTLESKVLYFRLFFCTNYKYMKFPHPSSPKEQLVASVVEISLINNKYFFFHSTRK